MKGLSPTILMPREARSMGLTGPPVYPRSKDTTRTPTTHHHDFNKETKALRARTTRTTVIMVTTVNLTPNGNMVNLTTTDHPPTSPREVITGRILTLTTLRRKQQQQQLNPHPEEIARKIFFRSFSPQLSPYTSHLISSDLWSHLTIPTR